MESLFCCPLCLGNLERSEGRYHCSSGHSFDVASAGYTHLLPANRKHSKNPGNDKEMVAARAAFLERGHYAPLLSALCAAVLDQVTASSPVLLEMCIRDRLPPAFQKSGAAYRPPWLRHRWPDDG